jgi:hypothetical protein
LILTQASGLADEKSPHKSERSITSILLHHIAYLDLKVVDKFLESRKIENSHLGSNVLGNSFLVSHSLQPHEGFQMAGRENLDDLENLTTVSQVDDEEGDDDESESDDEECKNDEYEDNYDETKENEGEFVKKNTDDRQPPSRKFKMYWLQVYPWLYAQKDEKTDEVSFMFCKICLRHKTRVNTFTKGTNVFKVDIIKKHLGSKSHSRGIEAMVLFSTLSSQIEKKLSENLTSSDAFKIIQLVMWILRENIAFVKYESLIQLTLSCGVKFNSASYKSRYGFYEMLKSIHQVIEQRLRKRLERVAGFSILCDTATDISTANYLISFIVFYDKFDQRVTCELLDLDEVVRGTGLAMHESLMKSFAKFGLDVRNLICLTTDGAAANLGEDSGLLGRFRKSNPRVLSVHCVSHRLHLLVTDCIDEIDELTELNQLLNDLHSFFRSSHVRTNSLKLWASILGEEYYNILDVLDVRWFSYLRALKNIRRNLKLIPLALRDLTKDQKDKDNEETADRAKRLLEKLSSFKILAGIHLVEDIFQDLNAVNMQFQTSFVSPLKIIPLVSTLKYTLRKSYLDGQMGNCLREFLDKVKPVPNAENRFEFETIPFILDQTSEEQSFLFMEAVVRSLLRRIDIRFPDSETMNNIAIISLENICHAQDVLIYGEKEIESLANLYGDPKYTRNDFVEPLLSREKLLQEWKAFKLFVVANYSSFFVKSPHSRLMNEEVNLKEKDAKELSLLNGIVINYEESFPNITKLIQFVFCMTATNAVSERGFSRQNLIKTKTRNGLGAENLRSALRVSLYAHPLSEIDYRDIISTFATSRIRKDFLHPK